MKNVNDKKGWIHKLLTCINSSSFSIILEVVSTWQELFQLWMGFTPTAFDWTVIARNVLELYQWSIVIAKTFISFVDEKIFALLFVYIILYILIKT